jgi:hypothetical protein
MKGIVILIILLAIGAFFVSMSLTREGFRDQGEALAVAFAAVTDETVEMQIGVPTLIPLADPPDYNEQSVPKWDEWNEKHFQMRDEAGKIISLRRIGTSALFIGEVAAGVPEFVLCADLKKGANYSCDFIPIVAKGKKYRYSFTVPTESQKVGRKTFELVRDQ